MSPMTEPRPPDRPNVVVILADDMGWGDPACNNPESLIPTPHMDRIAAQGGRLTRAYAASAVCTPSRYALLTARYAWRTRLQEGVLYGYCRHLIDEGRCTLGTVFQGLGYRTACIGKWHLGMDWAAKPGDAGDWGEGTIVRHDSHLIGHRVDFTKPITHGPTTVGFDEFFGCAGCPTCNAPFVFIENDHVTGQPVWADGAHRAPDWDHRRVDDIFVDKAIAFLERQGKDPFFLYLPLSAPHAPFLPPRRLEGLGGDGRRGEMVCWFDESVGRIAAALDRLGLADDTLVIVTSDNGGQVNPGTVEMHRVFGHLRENPQATAQELADLGLCNHRHRVNGPYRGFKTDIWDGGTRVPFLVRWPGRIPPGTVCDEAFGLIDLLPTLADLVGVRIPADQAEDGQARSRTLLGQGGAGVDRLITHSYTGVFALYRGPWKLIPETCGSGGHRGVTPEWAFREPDSPGQLYHLGVDPWERENRWDDPGLADLKRGLLAELQGVRQGGHGRGSVPFSP